MISSQVILERTDIKSAKTLTRWYQQGLIPEPTLQTHPSGRGKMAFWPAWVLNRIGEVKSLLSQGYSLDVIAERLGSDWEAEAKRWLRIKPSLAKAEEATNRAEANWKLNDALVDAVYEFLQQIGIQRPGMVSVGTKLDRGLSPSLIRRSVELVRQGFNPVLVIRGDEFAVSTDFMLATAVSKPELQSQPMLVVPLGGLIRDAFTAKAEPDLPAESRYLPIERVLEGGGRRPRERSYRSNGRWEFEIDE